MDLDAPDTRLNNGAPARKLGFGLVGSGKRTTVLSVFHEEDEEDANKEKKMRPLVPIDYTKEELQAVQSSNLPGVMPPNLAAAAEFAKRISNGSTKEDMSDTEREKNKWPNERFSQRQRERTNEEISRGREDDNDKDKMTDNKKLLDAKQLIDMIPKTKEELFSYEINWSIYDKVRDPAFLVLIHICCIAYFPFVFFFYLCILFIYLIFTGSFNFVIDANM